MSVTTVGSDGRFDGLLKKFNVCVEGGRTMYSLRFDEDFEVDSLEELFNLFDFFFAKRVNWSCFAGLRPRVMAKWRASNSLIVSEWNKKWNRGATSTRFSPLLAMYYLNALANAIEFDEFLRAILQTELDEFGHLFIVPLNTLLNILMMKNHSRRYLNALKDTKKILSTPGFYPKAIQFVLSRMRSMDMNEWCYLVSFFFVHGIFANFSQSSPDLFGGGFEPKSVGEQQETAEISAFRQFKQEMIRIYKDTMCHKFHDSGDAFWGLLKYGLSWEEFRDVLVPSVRKTILKSPDSLPFISRLFRVVSDLDGRYIAMKGGISGWFESDGRDLSHFSRKRLELELNLASVEPASFKSFFWMLGKFYVLRRNSFNLGPVMGSVVDSVFEYICSKSANLREQARMIFNSLVFGATEDELLPLLTKIDSFLAKWSSNEFERRGLHYCLISLCEYASGVALSVVDRYIPLVLKYVEMEKRKENFGVAFMTLGMWIGLDVCRVLKQDFVRNFFVKGIRSNNAQFYLASLCKSMNGVFMAIREVRSRPEVSVGCDGGRTLFSVDLGDVLRDELIRFVRDSNTKFVLRPEAIMSFAILLVVSASNPAVRKHLDGEKLWSLIEDRNSFLRNDPRSLLAKVSAKLAIKLDEALAMVVEVGMMQFGAYGKANLLWTVVLDYLESDATLDDCRMLTESLHRMGTSDNGPKIMSSFLALSLERLEQLGIGTENIASIGHGTRGFGRIFIEFVYAIATPQLDNIVDDFGRLLLIISHPLITVDPHRHKFKFLVNTLHIDEESILRAHGAEIFSYLVEYGLKSKCTDMRIAVHRAIIYLTRFEAIADLFIVYMVEFIFTRDLVDKWLSLSVSDYYHWLGTWSAVDGGCKWIEEEKKKHAPLEFPSGSKKTEDTQQDRDSTHDEDIWRRYIHIDMAIELINLASIHTPHIFSRLSVRLLYAVWGDIVRLACHGDNFMGKSIMAIQNIVYCIKGIKPEWGVISALIHPNDHERCRRVIERLRFVEFSNVEWSIVQPIFLNYLVSFVEDDDMSLDSAVQTSRDLSLEVRRVVFEILDRHGDYINLHLVDSLMKFVESGRFMWDHAVAILVDHAGSWSGDNEVSLDALEALLKYLHSPLVRVRNVVLRVLNANPRIFEFAPRDLTILSLFFARFDPDEFNSKMAVSLYEAYNVDSYVPKGFYAYYEPYLVSVDDVVREMAGRSIAVAMNAYEGSEIQIQVVDSLIRAFELHFGHLVEGKRQSALVSTKDSFKDSDTCILWRRGVVAVFSNFHLIAIDQAVIDRFFSFSMATALFDSQLYESIIQIGVSVIDAHGKAHLDRLYERFNSFTPGQLSLDVSKLRHRVHQAVTVWLGSVAQHLPEGDPRFESTVDRLLVIVKIPLEPIQMAVSRCFSRLVNRISDVDKMLNRCLDLALGSEGDYGARRGGAWSFAGFIKGLKPIALHERRFVVDRIRQALGRPNVAGPASGACMVCECLSLSLKVGFEPWAIGFADKLVQMLGASTRVAEVAFDALQVVLGQVSVVGICVMLEKLFGWIDSFVSRWKVRMKVIELLGVILEYQPLNLGLYLPVFIPRLLRLINDSHTEVQRASKVISNSLNETVKNVDVKCIVGRLLAAIDDFDMHGAAALEAFGEIRFSSRIDGVSLALLVPILRKAFVNQVFETKVKAMKIAASICDLVIPSDLDIYYGELYGSLMALLGDAVPEIRHYAAQGLARLVSLRGKVEEVVGELMRKVQGDPMYVERLGAAQGLACLASYLDYGCVRSVVLDPLVVGCESELMVMRQGSLLVIQFLPESLGTGLVPFVELLLSCVIRSLSDEQEAVREAALMSGRSIISKFAKEKLEVLIPIFERAMLDNRWRVRSSSVQLLDDLLGNVMSDEGRRLDEGWNGLTRMLETERGRRVLAGLYMLRHDEVEEVKQRALACWKNVVVNTAKLLKQLENVTMELVFEGLGASKDEEERRTIAAKSLADLVSKLGDATMNRALPRLAACFDSPDVGIKKGVCTAVYEMFLICPSWMRGSYFTEVIGLVSRGLCDEDGRVRELAAMSLDCLSMGRDGRVVDTILPQLLSRTESGAGEGSQWALAGIREVLRGRASVVLPHLFRSFLKPPISVFGANALSSIAEAAGTEMAAYISTVFPVLMRTAFQQSFYPCENPESVLRALHSMMLAVSSRESMTNLVLEWKKWSTESSPVLRAETQHLIAWFVENKSRMENKSFAKNESTIAENKSFAKNESGMPRWCPEYWKESLGTIIQITFRSYHDPDTEVVRAAIEATSAVLSTIDLQTASVHYVQSLNDILESMRLVGTLEGFDMGGVMPLVRVYVVALRSGSQDARIQACIGFDHVIRRSSVLAPETLQAMFGPLIRILSEQHLDLDVRSRAMDTLNVLMENGGDQLKAFASTLQVLFMKALYCPSEKIRNQTCIGLPRILRLGTKPDFFLRSLVMILNDKNGFFDSSLRAIALASKNLQTIPSEETVQMVLDAIHPHFRHPNTQVRRYISVIIIGLLKPLASKDFIKTLDKMHLLNAQLVDDQLNEVGLLVIYKILRQGEKNDSHVLVDGLHLRELSLKLLRETQRTEIKALTAKLLGYLLTLNDEKDPEIAQELVRILNDEDQDDIDVIHTIIHSIMTFAKRNPRNAQQYLSHFVNPILNKIKKSTIFNVRYEAVKALFYLFQLNHDHSTYLEFAESIPPPQKSQFIRLCKKLTTKNFAESDSENDD